MLEDALSLTLHLSSCIDNLPKNSELFILGDLNVDMLKRNNLTSCVKDLCTSKNVKQYVTSSTRITSTSSILIDLVFSNSKNITKCEVVEIGISDHSLVYILRDRVKISRSSKTIKIISKLDNNKATGLDGISVRALKAGSPVLSIYLAYLFNLSLNTGVVPESWKEKRVTPLFKKGETDDLNN